MPDPPATEETDKTAPAPSPAEERIKRFRGAITSIRRRANLSAKATGALGTAALSGIAIGKFSYVFPLDPSNGAAVFWAIVAILGFIALAFSIAWFTVQLWRVDSPVSMPITQAEVDAQLKGDLAAATWQRYERTCASHGAPSLRALDSRARRFRRIAARLPDTDKRRDRLLAQAKEIGDEVTATTAEAAADIVRAHARDVLMGGWTLVATVAFVLGLVGVAVGADYLDGERTGKVNVAKECAAAGKALEEQTLAERDLPPICSDLVTDGEAASEDEKKVAFANDCASTVKALNEAKLDTSALTGAGGPCPAAEEDEEEAPETPEDVANAVLPELLELARRCETAASANNQSAATCDPLYDVIAAEQRRRQEARRPG